MPTPEHPLTIRDVISTDTAAVASLLGELGFPASETATRARLEAYLAAGEVALLATRGERPVGLVTLHVTRVLHRPTPVGRITALVVTEDARGTQVGRALVREAEHRLAAAGCALVEVTSNRRLTPAHAFYERLGYENTSYRFKRELVAETPDHPEP